MSKTTNKFSPEVSARAVRLVLVHEGWIKVTAGAAKDRFGNPMTIKLKGQVEPNFKD